MNNITGVGPANGTAQTLEVYVSIRWPWLIFSTTLVVAAIVLLVITLLDTARRDIAHWRLSPIPILLQALGEPKPHDQNHARDVMTMERLANDMKVELSDLGSGSRLLRVQATSAKT